MTTAGNFGTLTVVAGSDSGGLKTRIISALGPATYSANGSELDLSSDATDGLSNKYDAFAVVYSVVQCGVGAHAGDVYRCMYIPAASGAAATGTVKIRDLTASSDAEASGDLHATTFYFMVTGR